MNPYLSRMKKIPYLLTFAILALLTNCEKEEKACSSCVLVIANGEGYDYKVSFSGITQTPFTLRPGEVQSVSIPSGVLVTVKGDLKSPYAHNDFSKAYQCPSDCGSVAVALME